MRRHPCSGTRRAAPRTPSRPRRARAPARPLLPPLLLLTLTLTLTPALAACSGAASSPAPPAEVDPGIDADPYAGRSPEALSAAIAEARRVAAANDRRVLLTFIADWCPDCREVVRLGREPGPAREVLSERYVVVYVDVGRFDRHRALLEEHGVERIATLVVLDPETGARVARTSMEPITGAERGLTSGGLAAWLRDPQDG